MIGDPLLGDDDETPAASAAEDDVVPAAEDDVTPAADEPAPEPTRQVPAPVLPPHGLGPGVRQVPSDEPDPLWAATVRPAGAPSPPRSAPADLAATTAMPAVTPPATGDLAATTAMPVVVAAAADQLAPTAAIPGVARHGGPQDTMVMPAVTAPPPGAEHADGFAKMQRRHRRRWWRRAFKAVLVLVFLGIAYVGFNFALVLRTAHTDQARPVDVIVVLGAAQYDGRPSPQLQARLDHTLDLWERNLADTVFVTGGNQPGDRFTEAEASRTYLVDHGVPADAIQMEDTAHSTWESFANLAAVADARGWERILIVTDPFHSLRSRLIAQELGFTAYTSPTQTSPVQGGDEVMKELKEALGISLGRIIGFERLWKLTG